MAALVNSVSGTFGRRDFLRRNMDKIEAMIADSGVLLGSLPCLLTIAAWHVVLTDAAYDSHHEALGIRSAEVQCRRVCGLSGASRSGRGVL